MMTRRWMSWLMVLALLLCLSPAMGQAGEVAWDVNYQPGTAEGRHGLPADAATSPRWRAISFAEPAKVTLGTDYLQIATGSDEKPLVGAAAFQVNLEKPAEAFTLAVEVAVPLNRADHYAGGLILGSGSKFTILQLGSGHNAAHPCSRRLVDGRLHRVPDLLDHLPEARRIVGHDPLSPRQERASAGQRSLLWPHRLCTHRRLLHGHCHQWDYPVALRAMEGRPGHHSALGDCCGESPGRSRRRA